MQYRKEACFINILAAPPKKKKKIIESEDESEEKSDKKSEKEEVEESEEERKSEEKRKKSESEEEEEKKPKKKPKKKKIDYESESEEEEEKKPKKEIKKKKKKKDYESEEKSDSEKEEKKSESEEEESEEETKKKKKKMDYESEEKSDSEDEEEKKPKKEPKKKKKDYESEEKSESEEEESKEEPKKKKKKMDYESEEKSDKKEKKKEKEEKKEESEKEKDKLTKYKIINKLCETKNGILFLVSDIENKNEETNKYILNKIELNSIEKKKQIENEINILKKINNKYIIKIIDYFIANEKEKEIMCIITNYYKNNLSKLIYQTNYLNHKNVWKIFIQIILGLNNLILNNVLPEYLLPQNIYLDNENKVIIGGINMISDSLPKDKQELSILSYKAPEIINGEKHCEKSLVWTVGCILYELAFKKPAFGIENLKNNIIEMKYDLPNNYDKEICLLIPKLLCEKDKRLLIQNIILDKIFKIKIIEVNLFLEIIRDNLTKNENIATKIKDFLSYFDDINFDGKESLNNFQSIEFNEYPFYLICQKCGNFPSIELLKNNKNIKISCSKCNYNKNEKIENIVNYSSKYVTNAINFCNLPHKEKIPANIYCKIHDLFICHYCLELHKEKKTSDIKKDNFLLKEKGEIINDINKQTDEDDLIKICFININGAKIFIYISKKTSINKTLKTFLHKINLSENFIDEINFTFKNKLLNKKSEESLEENLITNDSEINVIYPINCDFNDYIELFKIKKNICIFHNKELTLNCIQCNVEICDECMKKHNNHSIEKLSEKYKNINEFNDFIINYENKKRKIYEELKNNINLVKTFINEGIDLKDKIEEEVNKMINLFYNVLYKGQNLFFLSKILFATNIKSGIKDDMQYKKNINSINDFLSEEIIKEFNMDNLKKLKKKFLSEGKNIDFIFKEFQDNEDFKEENKCIYDSSYNFIPQIKLIFNDVKIIDKEIIDSLIENINIIFNGKDVKIIEIRKGSLITALALNYLIQENLEKINKNNADDILKGLNNLLKIETKNIKNVLLNNLTIKQKDKTFKPNYATENFCDLESDIAKDELAKCIKKNKNNNNDINIFEFSKSISADDLKKFFDSLYNDTKKTQENLYDSILKNINNELDKYLQIFDDQFEESLKKSIFEYNSKYIAYVYRFDKDYNSAQSSCGNIEKKILFHGTNSFCISRILSSQFRNSSVHIFGPGVYFSDSLDYAWFYADDSDTIGSRKNFYTIPKINDSFSFIVVNAYYNKSKFEQVYDCNKRDIPVLDYGIRHILVNYQSAPIPQNNLNYYNNRFKGTEYLLSNRNQILPLLSVTVERVKYLIVWRDNNFNKSNPNNYSNFDEMLKYNNEIKNYCSFNLKTKIYFLNESSVALNFINRKKYNKIILITNGGNNGGDFITEARKIIGKDTIALVTCFAANNHLSWVKDVNNVLLNSPQYDCMKDFLKSVCNENLNALKNLQKETEKKLKELDKSFSYKELNNDAFNFPKFKENGSFGDIYFD